MTGARDEPKAFVKNAANHEVIRVHPDGSVSYAEDVTAEHLRWALEHVARQLAATRAASPVSASGGGETREDAAALAREVWYRTVAYWPPEWVNSDAHIGKLLDAIVDAVIPEQSAVPPASGGAATSEPDPENIALRREWWLSHKCGAGIAALYGDDGEMQCHGCMIDFKRFAPNDISARLANARRAASVPRLGTELDETIPPNEVHFRQDGQTVAKITGLGTEEGR